MQVLFEIDLGKTKIDKAFKHTVEEFEVSIKAQQFARELVEGTLKHKNKLDEVIKSLSKNWSFDRFSAVDRNIIRLALYEIFCRSEIPPAVSVNEAVELAKIFGNEESSRFINGILGRVVETPAEYIHLVMSDD